MLRVLRRRLGMCVLMLGGTLAGLVPEVLAASVIATIPVGTNPHGVAANPVTNRVYVANIGGNSVTVIDSATNGVVTTIPGLSAPFGVAVNSATNRIYVVNAGNNTVSVIDGVTSTLIGAAIGVGTGPEGIAVNESTNRVYVAIFNAFAGTTVSVIDATGPGPGVFLYDRTVGTAPNGVAVNRTTNRIYVTNYNSNTVSVLDGSAADAVVATIPVGANPNSLDVDRTTNRVYVANTGPDTLTVISGATDLVIPPPIPTGLNPDGVAVSAAGKKAYVANNVGDSVSIVNTVTNTVEQTLTVGDQPREIAFNAFNRRIYVANFGSATVSVIEDPSACCDLGTTETDIAGPPVNRRIQVTGSGRFRLRFDRLTGGSIDQFFDLVEDAGATLDLAGGSGASFNSYPSLYTNDVWYNAFPAPTPSWYGWASGDGVTPDSKLELLEATATRVKVRQEAFLHHSLDQGAEYRMPGMKAFGDYSIYGIGRVALKFKRQTTVAVTWGLGGSTSSDSGWNVHWENAGALNSWTAYNKGGQLASGAPDLNLANDDFLLLRSDYTATAPNVKTDFLAISQQDWPNANQSSWDELGAPDNAGLAGWSDTGSSYNWNPGDSESFNYLTYFKPTNLGSGASPWLDPAVTTRSGDYRVPGTVSAVGPGTPWLDLDEGTSLGDAFNESEAAYLFDSHATQGLAFTLAASAAAPRFSPFLKVRQWRYLQDPPSSFAGNLRLTNDVDFKADVKPLSRGHFANSLAWHCTGQDAASCTTPDVGSSGNLIIGGASSVVTARYGRGLRIGDNASYYSASASDFNISTGAVEFWYQPNYDSTNGSTHMLWYNSAGSGPFDCIWLDHVGQDLVLRARKDATNQSCTIGFTSVFSITVIGDLPNPQYHWRAGDWVHLRAEWETSGGARLFVDGRLVGGPTGLYSSSGFSTSSTLIGSCNLGGNCPGGGASRNADGIIDEPHIYTGGIASGNPATYAYAGLVGDAREFFADSSGAKNTALINSPIAAGNKGQYLYFGADSRFHGLNMSFQSFGSGPLPGALVWQYWRDNGAGTEGWADLEGVLNFIDGTVDFTQNGTVKWDADPTDWKPYSVNGGPDLFYVRVHLGGPTPYTPFGSVESLIKTDILLYQYCGDLTADTTLLLTTPTTTEVRLQSFSAVPGDASVGLEWRTASELSNLGFHVYRSSSANGPWSRLTTSLVPGLGSSAVGQAYSFRDTGLSNGTRYFYRLEDVDASSKTTSHGPVSAVPSASAPASGSPGTGTDGAKTNGASASSCPDWVLSAYTSMSGSSSASALLRCTRHGDPEAASLEVLSRDARAATLELRTPGFYALHEPAGTVRVFVPGFDFPQDEKAAALPIRRALVDAVVGRGVKLGGVRALDLARFDLAPSALGKAEMQVGRDGTVRAARRGSRPLAGHFPKGELVTLLPSLFQGERKSVVLEIAPLRFDARRQQLVLAKRLRVRLLFAGREAGERGKGSVGRSPGSSKPVSGEILARLFTASRGLHAASFEQLFPGRPRGFAASQLRLERQGEPVAFHVEPVSDVFGPGSQLYFFGDQAAASTDFSAEVAYELVRSTRGLRMATASAAPAGDAIASASTGRAFFETNRFYQPGLLEAPDPWLWEAVASGATRVKSFSLTGVDASGAPAGLIVSLQGASESGQAVDHHVSLSVNGTLVGEARFAGKKPYPIGLSVPASLLREGSNELSLTNVADTGVSSLVFLDHFTLSYPQAATLSAGKFEGTWAEAGAASIAGVTGAMVLLDVTDAASTGSPRITGASAGSGVRWLRAFDATGGSLRFRAEAGRRYLADSLDALVSPRIAAAEPSTLRAATNQADYLLVAPRAFLAAAEPLLQRRADQGLITRGVAFEEIADAFGHGQASAEAIKSFLAFAFHSWRRPSPRYVLLLGDSTYDPRNFIGSSQPSPLPVLWAKTSYLWTAADPQLAAVNGEDALPDLAIGRLPAATVEQAQALVQKLIAWEDSGQGLNGKAALVADNPDVAGDFEADVREIAEGYLAGRSELLMLSQHGPGLRPRILDALNSGLSFLNYVGHGGAAVWASENVWNTWDAPSLLAQSQQPLLVTMNCLNGYFVAPSFESLSESLLKAEGRGAIASFSPSGLSLDGPAHRYHRALMAELTSGRHERLGDAVLAAQTGYAQTGLMPELLSIYHLLGDPATRIQSFGGPR